MRQTVTPPPGHAQDGHAQDGREFRERLEQRLAFDHLIAALSTDFINAPAERLDALIEAALGRIGSLFTVDRAYLFRFSADRATMSNTHEWVADGIGREAHNLQDVPFGTFPWLMGELVAGRDVHVLEIEITESSLITDTEHAAASLARLRAAAPGVSIAIDDFGSGYSSLAYLGRLPISTLKIDRCFTAELGHDGANARAIVRSIVDLSRNLGLRVVVEGVETEQQAEQLIALDCHEAQGFLFAAPLDVDAATAVLASASQTG